MLRVLLSTLVLLPLLLCAQAGLPLEVNITPDGRLQSGGNDTEGLYKIDDIHKLEITLQQPNWFQLLDGVGGGGPGGGGIPGISLIGTLTYNDDLVLDSVLVSIKGQTSDSQNNSEKKSFKIEIDELKDQDLLGYDNLNLNCGFQDRSSMREVLYYDISRHFTPALKGAFIDLYINGEYWGPYSNIQQIEGTYIKEWFTDNNGTRWRAIYPDDAAPTGGPGGGGMAAIFGTGVSTLNYNGPDSTDYIENYTLKKTEKENPWEDLILVCEKLNNTPIANLYDELNNHFDIDRALWVLAQEIIFSDDDSYIYKGGMDYYVYWDNATGLLMPLEVDGNSVMINGNDNWDIFYNEDDDRFPLMNRLLQNQEVRQRYLAHVRTILENHFVEAPIHERIDEFAAVLDQRVQDDPKKIYTYGQFTNGVDDLKDFISDRINFVSANTEVNRTGITLSDVVMESPNGTNIAPGPGEAVQISVTLDEAAQRVVLYYGTGLDGAFERLEMFDDGQHNDQQAGDNIYGGTIPGFPFGRYVRYYIEAIKNDAFATASYIPAGAQHDVYIYRVDPVIFVPADLVINEFMADNEETIADMAGETDDWIELYNKGNVTIDLTGYFLSDNEQELNKWQFPDNTTLGPNEYLIIWADNDEDQSSLNELHANFKLSKSGETIILSNANEEVIDLVQFGDQTEDAGYARIPNGTGSFQFRTPTFAANNDNSTTSVNEIWNTTALNISPNPAQDQVMLTLDTDDQQSDFQLDMFNAAGERIMAKQVNMFGHSIFVNIGHLPTGYYFVCLKNETNGKIYNQRLVIVK